MTNREAYKDILDNILGEVVAVADGKPELCATSDCKRCLFRDSCGRAEHKKEIIDWLNAEYQEPPVDWSKVPIDTPVLAQGPDGKWRRRYLAGYNEETERPFVFESGKTSWSTDGYTRTPKAIKLAECNE